MIIGNGFMANGFKSMDRDDIIIFASGVSNSKLTDRKEFQREERILTEALSDNGSKRMMIYFSTYSINDPSLAGGQYISHKRAMEAHIQSSDTRYLIVRASNIIGLSYNPFTITNYIYNRIVKGEQFELWINAYRNLLDIEHLYKMVEQLLKEGISNETVYLVCPIEYHVLAITKALCFITKKEAHYREIEKGSCFEYDRSLSARLFTQLKISSENYLETLLKKYYPDQIRQA